MSPELIIAIIAALFAFITIIQTYRANKFSKLVAINQKVFDKPNIYVQVFNKQIEKRINDIILALPINQGRVIMLPFDFYIINKGEKTAKEVELYIRIQKDLHFGMGKEYLSHLSFSEDFKDLKARMISESEYMHTIGINIKSLHPNQAFILQDHLSIGSATFNEMKTPPIKTKDGVDIVATIQYQFAYGLDFVIMQEDYKPISNRINLTIVDILGKSIKETIDEYNKLLINNITKKEKNKIIGDLFLIAGEEKNILRDEDDPLDRVKSLSVYEGIRLKGGVIIPSLGIFTL